MMVRIRFKLNLLALTLLIVGIDSSSSSSSGNLRTASPRRLRQRRDAMIQDRIIGGNVVKTPYPFFGLWIVGCGASLIHDDIMLTAAHCDLGDPFARDIMLGAVTMNDANAVYRSVTKVLPHPNYNDVTNGHDFAILKLNATALIDWIDPITVTVAQTKQSTTTWRTVPTGLEVVPLNTDFNTPSPNDELTIMGFGVTDPSSIGLKDELYDVTVTAFDDDSCDAAYPRLFEKEVMMCAGDSQGGKDSCQGDSGGPMLNKDGTQVGIVSWGQGCGEAEHPGVYSRVVSVNDWIQEQICRNSCYPPDTCDPELLHPCAAVEQGPRATIDLNGQTSITIKVTMDTYPSEFAAIFTHYETGTELWYSAYDSYTDSSSVAENLLVVEQKINKLPAGIYHLLLGDKSADGLCCRFGEGGIEIVNTDTGDLLWSDNGDYGRRQEVYLKLTATGEAAWVASNPDGTSSSDWQETDTDNDDLWDWLDQDSGVEQNSAQSAQTQENGEDNVSDMGYDPSTESSEWPGRFPSVNAIGTVLFNIRSDQFPEETSWTFSKRTAPNTFSEVQSGSPNAGSTLFSIPLSLEADSVYKLEILDSMDDGTCCLYGGGWFTLTNSTANVDREGGTVIWDMTGNGFEDQATVFLWADVEVNAHLVEYIPGEGYALVMGEMVSGERIIVMKEEEEEAEHRVPTEPSVDRHSLFDP